MKEIIKNIFFLLSLVAVISIGVVSCEIDDNTGYSTLVPKTPTITITPAFTSPMTLTENGSKYKFTVTLSEPQIVDVKLNITQISGTADASDYTLTSSLVIPVGTTSASGEIQIKSDDLKEATETLTIQIGDATTGNATITPITVTFNINNLTSGDLVVDMSWATDVLDAVGMDLAPSAVVDLRLLLVNSAGQIVDAADGASFETLTLSGANLPNGDYLIAADIYSTINAGDFNAPITLDLNLDFNQVGIINNTSLSFPAVMTNTKACDLYRTNLATVKKVGSVYTITKAVSYLIPAILTWKGTDADYPSKVTTTASCTSKTMTGLGFGWMLDWWGEIIVSGGTLTYTTTGNTITIPLQKYCKTTYNGAAQPEYSIQGTGTINNSGAFPVWTIHYDFIQSGSSIATICLDYGWPTPYFEAIITTNPAGN